MPSSSATATATYVYGVVKAKERAEQGPAIGGEPVEVVAHEGVAALVSRVPGEELEAGREELLTHSRVLEEALRQGAVLPMKFGVVMPSDEVVRSDLLEAHHDELLRQLGELEGKVELNVKGIYDEAAVIREIVAEQPEIAQLRAAIAGKPEDATYPERIRLGELVAQALEAKRAHDEEAIVSCLSPHAIGVDVGPPVHERMAVNGSFLVAENTVEEFDAELERVATENAERIRFKETGPLPPHSFVELSVEG